MGPFERDPPARQLPARRARAQPGRTVRPPARDHRA
jgi:hypothetical protein